MGFIRGVGDEEEFCFGYVDFGEELFFILLEGGEDSELELVFLKDFFDFDVVFGVGVVICLCVFDDVFWKG